MIKPKTTFKGEHLPHAYPNGIEYNFWNLARNALLPRICNAFRAEPLLEIGAGRGIVLLGFQEAGWQVQGVELSPEATPVQTDLPFRSGLDAFELPLAERQQYRSLGLFDVLEHLPDRPALLGRLLKAFPNVQYLYVTVPALPALWTNYDEYYGHYLRYTQKVLREELAAGGWKPVAIGYFFHALILPIWLQKLLARKREIKYHPPVSCLSRASHRLLGSYFYWESRLLPASLPGTSLYAIAKSS